MSILTSAILMAIFPGTPPVPLPSQGHFPMEISPLVGSSLERFSLVAVLFFRVISPEAGMDFSHYYERFVWDGGLAKPLVRANPPSDF